MFFQSAFAHHKPCVGLGRGGWERGDGKSSGDDTLEFGGFSLSTYSDFEVWVNLIFKLSEGAVFMQIYFSLLVFSCFWRKCGARPSVTSSAAQQFW